jgi:D-alanyl-D-alanine carboxypeptidase
MSGQWRRDVMAAGRLRPALVLAGAALVVACGGGSSASGGDEAAGATATTRPPATTTDEATGEGPPASTTTTDAVGRQLRERPGWLGRRVLDTAPGQPPPPTPAELDPRALATVDVLPPPADGGFHSTVQPVPAEVAARSTWHDGCPVPLDDLRYVTVSFWGFDGRAHTGELIVHRRAAEPIAHVFAELFEHRFPIEDLHVTSADELDAPDTGDGNASAAFVCRATRGASSWSQHAYGLAVDINPFQNPYTRDGGVIPGLASSYLDRATERPGMLHAGDTVTGAFAAVGWRWGGTWSEPDLMHFSANGR